MTELQEHLRGIRACSLSIKLAGDRTPIEAWQDCFIPSYLIWWASNTPVNSYKDIVWAACTCCRRSTSNHDLDLLDIIEDWCSDPSSDGNRAQIAARQLFGWRGWTSSDSDTEIPRMWTAWAFRLTLFSAFYPSSLIDTCDMIRAYLTCPLEGPR